MADNSTSSLESSLLYQSAMAAFERNDASEALSLLQKTVEENPKHYLAWNNIGFILFRAGHPKEAEHAFQQALQTEPGYVDALVNLAYLYIDQADFSNASVFLERLKLRDSANPDIPDMEKKIYGAFKFTVKPGKSAPLCTIVMATYNRPKLVEVAIKSVLAQTYPNIELCLVNDGGCDISNVVAKFNDPRIRYFPLPVNLGAAHAYNYAIYQSKGEYIGYVADDDLLYPNHAETLVSVLEAHPEVSVAYSDQFRVTCEMENGEYTKIIEKRVDYSYEFDRMLMMAHANFIPHPCIMHRRDLFKQTGYYDEKLTVLIDWDLLRRMAFYTDFYHVKVITGEYFFPSNKKERISDIYQKDQSKWYACRDRLYSKRPPRPWKNLSELNVFIYCDRIGEKPVSKLKLLRQLIHVPARFLFAIDNCDANAKEVLRAVRDDDVKLLLNVTPTGLDKTLELGLNAFARSDDWLLVIDDTVEINDAWYETFLQQVRALFFGQYQQPATLTANAIFTNPAAVVKITGR